MSFWGIFRESSGINLFSRSSADLPRTPPAHLPLLHFNFRKRNPPPRLRGGRLMRQPPSLGTPFFSISRGFPREIPLSTSSLERHRLSGTASRGLPLGTVSGTLSGLPLGSLSGQTLREEFWILGARPPSAQFSRSSPELPA